MKFIIIKENCYILLRQLNTPPDVIPAKAGIQANTGCRIKSGMTAMP
jgi:hypothetical protein